MTEIEVTRQIIGCAIDVHRALGPGLLENVYQECLIYELNAKGLYVEREKRISVIYEGVQMKATYRIDILVEERIVVELKSVEAITDVHRAQILTYLRLGDFRHGLILNFNVGSMRKGIEKFINGYE